MQLKRIFMVGVVVASLAGCQSEALDFVPEPLVGVWETTAEKYSDRIFELRTDQIIFGTGGDSVAEHMVLSVEETQEGGSALYTVHYLGDDGDAYTFAFYYDPTRDIIQFKNQARIEWTRSNAS